MESINEIMRDNSSKSHFTGLIAKAKYLEKLNNFFSKILDSTLATHCFIAKFENDELTLVVDSPTWATKLRYAIPDLLKNLKCQSEFKSVAKINYCISPKNENVYILKKKKNLMTEENEKYWNETLKSLKTRRK
jgi:hypothetical protein